MLGKGCWRHVWPGNMVAFLSETCLSTALLQSMACSHRTRIMLLFTSCRYSCSGRCLGHHMQFISQPVDVDLMPHAYSTQGTELKSVGGDEHTKDSFTSRTKMVLSSLQTNFEAAAEQGSVKKRRLSSNSSHGSAPQVALLCTLLCVPVCFVLLLSCQCH